MPRPLLVVVMGVSGSGKSTIGSLLAERLGVPFLDADDLHPQRNVATMAAGRPLTDDDRRPWLVAVGEAIAAADTGLVVACSALKRHYRETILEQAPLTRFVELDGSPQLLLDRLSARQGHFMPLGLLESQLDTLEPLATGEPGFRVGIEHKPGELAGQIAARLHD